jgi:hypothetical protein
MIRAIPVPKSIFNPSTKTWEVPGLPTPNKVSKKASAPCKPVFSGDKSPVRAPWWDDMRAKTPKCWKHQSRRNKQHYRGTL